MLTLHQQHCHALKHINVSLLAIAFVLDVMYFIFRALVQFQMSCIVVDFIPDALYCQRLHPRCPVLS